MAPNSRGSPREKRLSFEDDRSVHDVETIRSMLQEESDSRTPSRTPPATSGRRKIAQPMIAHALSGMVGSICAELLLFPVDNIKLIIQTARAGEASGFLATLMKVLRERGIGGLYKGISVSVLKESVHSLNFWLWHGLLFRHLAKADDTSKTPASARLLLNLVAKQLNWLCTTPFEVVSAVNQLAPDSPGFIATALALYRREGLGAFYRGLAVSLTLAINPAIMNTLITSLLRLVAAFRTLVLGQDYSTARDHGPATIGVTTAISKFVATAGTYPLIRVKVLQQTSSSAQLGVMALWRSILAEEGVGGLYRGLLPMSYKTVCWNAVMMMFKHALGPKRAITPPCTPPEELDPSSLVPPVPWMGRVPFPAELVTVEKLDEILSYIKRDPGEAKVNKLETRMNHMSQELREVKHLLGELVQLMGDNPPSRRQSDAGRTEGS